MTRVGVARLKAELSRYLNAAREGQDVVITDRGRPVARLVWLHGAESVAGRRARLTRAGILLPGRGRVRASLRRAPKGTARSGRAVLNALVDERAEGR